MKKILIGIFVLLMFLAYFYFTGPSSSRFDPAASDNKPTALQSMDTDDLAYSVTGTFSPESIDAGTKILDQGGSAMDAALTVALSQTAVTGGKYTSYAGILNCVYYEAKTGTVHNLNASYNTVLAEKNPSTIPRVDYSSSHEGNDVTNGRTVLVPGFMKGIESAHERFGKVPLQKLFEHAISLAENGIKLNRDDLLKFSRSKDILSKYPETKAIFTKADGSFYELGDTFKQPVLANTLRKVAAEGADYMYTGEWGKKFVETVSSAGGKISMQDMENYEVIWSTPERSRYLDYDIYAHGLPAIGGTMLLQAMNLAEAAQLHEMSHYSESPESLATLYLVASTNDLYSYPRYLFGGSYWGDARQPERLEKATAKKVWRQRSKYLQKSKDRLKEYRSEHSAAIVATDRWGNMIALIHSINTSLWGRNGLFVDGVSIPDSATFQQSAIFKAGPGNRVAEATTPGIAFRDGKPILAFSCINKGVIVQSFTSLLNILSFGMTPKEAIKAPGFGGLKHSSRGAVLVVEPGRFSAEFLKSARDLGAILSEDKSVRSRSWSGIYRNYQDNSVEATEAYGSGDGGQQTEDTMSANAAVASP